MNKKELPSKEYLLSLFEYKDGKLFWKVKTAPQSRINIGDEVGNINNKGYLRTKINQKTYQLHNIIWKMFNGKDPEFEIDHINHDRSDNRIENLRDTKENHKNRSKSILNTSGYTNISFTKSKYKKYAVIFNCNKYFKSFLTLEEAIQHRNEKYIEFGFHKNHGG